MNGVGPAWSGAAPPAGRQAAPPHRDSWGSPVDSVGGRPGTSVTWSGPVQPGGGNWPGGSDPLQQHHTVHPPQQQQQQWQEQAPLPLPQQQPLRTPWVGRPSEQPPTDTVQPPTAAPRGNTIYLNRNFQPPSIAGKSPQCTRL